MTTYDIYLELNEAGNCFAHVPAIPGCMVRAKDQETAVANLPQMIRTHIERLLERDLLVEAPDGIELNIVEIFEGSGAFDPDDFTALFSSDKEPLSQMDLTWYLMHAAENRAELLRLTKHLPDELLVWQGREEAMSIGRILRHIARADQWYVSRLVEPGTLPAEWSEPEPESVWEFLGMVRGTAVERLHQLSEAELSAVHQPTHDTSNPDEQWTARKALRRMLEHEREHIDHIQAILTEWRRHFMVRLTAERSHLIWKLISFGEETLTEIPVFDNYTAKDLLAHIAAWDNVYMDRIQLVQAGRVSEISSIELEERNTFFYREQKDWPLSQSINVFLAARNWFEQTIAQVPETTFHEPVTLPWGDVTSIRSWSQWRYRHDGGHTADLAQWREANKASFTTGPKSLLLAAMDAAHQEMLATIALIPEDERETRLVCGDWTLKDVLGHVADWEWYGVEKWRPEQSNRSLQIAYPGIQEWNDRHAAARKDDTWERVWVDFINARSALRQILEDLDETELARIDPAPWNPNSTPYRWIGTWIHHEMEHAADLRLVLNLPNFPERLTRA